MAVHLPTAGESSWSLPADGVRGTHDRAPRRRPLHRRFRPGPAAVALAVTTGLTLLLFVFTAVDLAGLATVWENAHWTVASTGAAVAAAIGASTAADERERTVRRAAALALWVWAIGQVVWLAQLALGIAGFPTPADALFLATIGPAIAAAVASLRGRISRPEGVRLALDIATSFFASAALVIAFAGRDAVAIGGLTGIVVVGFPVFFVCGSIAALLIALATGVPFRLPGVPAMLAGLVVLGLGHTFWAPAASLGPVPPGTWFNYLFSIGLIVAAAGVATWQSGGETADRPPRIAVTIREWLPIAVVGAALATLAPELLGLDTTVVEPVVRVLAVTAVALAGLRQVSLLRDRAGALEAAQAATDATAAALARSELGESAQRQRAELRGRALAASSELVLRGDPAAVFGRVLATIAPPGTSALLATVDQDEGLLRVVAGSGNRAEPIIGQTAPIASVPAAHLDLLADGHPLAWAAGRAELPGPPVVPLAAPFSDRSPADAVSLVLPLLDGGGELRAFVHLSDPIAERTLEPGFVDLARLLANQLAVALENAAMLGEVRRQLAELRVMQERLVRASRLAAVGELAAGVAHEVNNPLTGVLGYADLLLAEAGPDDPSREGLGIIRAEALRAREIVRALLEFARPAAPHRTPSDLNAVVRGSLDLVRARLAAAGIELADRPGDLPPVDLDPAAIGGALMHVLDNAIRAMPRGGTLIVETLAARGPGGDEAVVRVSDTGAGMSDDAVRRAFEPFYSAWDQRGGEGGSQAGGQGLGLSLALVALEGHGGTIVIASRPGTGTSVELRLPVSGG